MRAALALRIFSGKIIFISRLSRSAERSKRIFTEKAAEINDISRHDPSCEKKVQESPQTFLNPKSKIKFP